MRRLASLQNPVQKARNLLPPELRYLLAHWKLISEETRDRVIGLMEADVHASKEAKGPQRLKSPEFLESTPPLIRPEPAY